MEKSLKPNNNRYDPAADIVIGMSDGIVIPFALAAGLTGALVSTNIILIAGLVEIAAGSIALGIGGYLTAKSEYPKFSTSVDLRTQQDPVNRRNNLDAFFSSLGLTGELKQNAVDELMADNQKWESFLLNYQSADTKPSNQLFRKSGITICISYIIGGIIPLIPFFIFDEAGKSLPISASITFSLLILFGIYKTRKFGSKIQSFFFEILIGILAAVAAYFVGRIFIQQP